LSFPSALRPSTRRSSTVRKCLSITAKYKLMRKYRKMIMTANTQACGAVPATREKVKAFKLNVVLKPSTIWQHDRSAPSMLLKLGTEEPNTTYPMQEKPMTVRKVIRPRQTMSLKAFLSARSRTRMCECILVRPTARKMSSAAAAPAVRLTCFIFSPAA